MSFASLGNASFHVARGPRALRRTTAWSAALLWAAALSIALLPDWPAFAFTAVLAAVPTGWLILTRTKVGLERRP